MESLHGGIRGNIVPDQVKLLGPHSPPWQPDFQPTVKAAIATETAILLDLFNKK
ncbi:MAG: hypothetical protein ACXWC4_18180 [Telluria sp.]